MVRVRARVGFRVELGFGLGLVLLGGLELADWLGLVRARVRV
jgi:hypothetical protein